MLQRLGRARSYSWIGAVADCAMRKAFGAASERDEADRRSRASAKMGPLRFKPYNVWHELRGKSGVPFALGSCKGHDAFGLSAPCHGYTACHRSLPKLPISDTWTLPLRPPVSKGSEASEGDWLGVRGAKSGLRDETDRLKGTTHLLDLLRARRRRRDRTRMPAQKAPATRATRWAATSAGSRSSNACPSSTMPESR